MIPVTVIYYDGNYIRGGWALCSNMHQLKTRADRPELHPMELEGPTYLTYDDIGSQEFTVNAIIEGLHDMAWVG